MIDLDQKYIDIIREIVNAVTPGFRVYVFGSRVTGISWRYSDIDILVSGDRALTPHERMEMQEAFDESDIPIRVDIVDRFEISDEFKRSIENQCEMIL